MQHRARVAESKTEFQTTNHLKQNMETLQAVSRREVASARRVGMESQIVQSLCTEAQAAAKVVFVQLSVAARQVAESMVRNLQREVIQRAGQLEP